jgi:hypothetical protein
MLSRSLPALLSATGAKHATEVDAWRLELTSADDAPASPNPEPRYLAEVRGSATPVGISEAEYRTLMSNGALDKLTMHQP